MNGGYFVGGLASGVACHTSTIRMWGETDTPSVLMLGAASVYWLLACITLLILSWTEK